MATIHPFRALRYDPAIVGDLSQVIAPPYDIIDSVEQDRLYASSPYNVVRLILGKEDVGDGADNNRYSRARRDFDAWRSKGVLRMEETPALYFVEHTFPDGKGRSSRLGFIGLLELNEETRRSVYRHEQTLAKPKEDRSKLLEAVPASLEPIFCIFPDEGAYVQSLLRSFMESKSSCMRVLLKDESIRVVAVTEPGTIQEICSRLAQVSMLIADGHHRFEVACAHRNQHGKMMCYFASMEDPALVVRPIHRVVLHKQAVKLDMLRELCFIDQAKDLSSLMEWLYGSNVASGMAKGSSDAAVSSTSQAGQFGYYDGSAFYCLRIRPERMARWLMAPSVPLALATLDVSILHEAILRVLGLANAPVQYVADAAQAVELTARTSGSSAWLLRGIALPQVYVLASKGMTLPPKSTYFYPKVTSGLVVCPYQ